MTKIGDLLKDNPSPVDYITSIYHGSDGLGLIEHHMLIRAGGKWYSELHAQWMELGHYGMAGHDPVLLPDVTDQNVEAYVTETKAEWEKEISERKQRATEHKYRIEQQKRET